MSINEIKEMAKKAKNIKPLWKGPEKDGITFSMLSKFLCCRERFRLLVINGIKPIKIFNHKIEYGNMWHICEEAYAQKDNWVERLKDYCNSLNTKFTLSRSEIDKWHNVCKIQFRVYVEKWLQKSIEEKHTTLFQEDVFSVIYKLPSGREVVLRGKFDKVFSKDNISRKTLVLQENKTKGDINELMIMRQLTFDLQTMLYMVALEPHFKNKELDYDKYNIKQVLYNVVKRPLSSGKGNIKQHKATKNKLGETKEHFYSRLEDIIRDNAKEHFLRLSVNILKSDLMTFRLSCLDPILEQLCDWWQCTIGGEPDKMARYYQSYRYPYGVFNSLAEGGITELDNYLVSGSMVGLEIVDTLFPELQEGCE